MADAVDTSILKEIKLSKLTRWIRAEVLAQIEGQTTRIASTNYIKTRQ